MTETTISEAYRAEQQRLHQNPLYGVASFGYAPLVVSLLTLGKCENLSDYGAGKCNLRAALGGYLALIDYFPYDPAYPEYGPPRVADLVTCIDVLEHVEPGLLDASLNDLASLTRRLALLTVHTGPAKKTLSDGRNAHLTQQPASWWLQRIAVRFDILHMQDVRKGFFVLVCPKNKRDVIACEIDFSGILRAAESCDPRPTVLHPRHTVAAVKRDAGAMWLAAHDPRTPWYVKALAGSVSVTALSPVDLTPDVIPVVGYLDDIILLAVGTLIAARLIPSTLMAELRTRATVVHQMKGAAGAAVVAAVWFAAVIAMALRLGHPAI